MKRRLVAGSSGTIGAQAASLRVVAPGTRRAIAHHGFKARLGLAQSTGSPEYWGTRLVILIVAAWTCSMVTGFQSGLALVSLAGLAATVVGLRRPTLGLLGVSMLCTLESTTGPLLMTGGLLRWNTFNYWLLVVLVLFFPVVVRLADPHSALLKVLIVLLGLELLVSADPTGGAQHLFGLVASFGLLTYFIRAGRDETTWYWMGIVNGVLAGLGGLVYLAQLEQLPYLNRNVWALFPVTALVAISLALHVTTTFRRQLVLGLLAVVNGVWVFLSASRGGLLVASLCLGFVTTRIRGRRRLAYVCAAFVLSIAVLTQFRYLEAQAVERWDQLSDTSRPMSHRTNNRSDLIWTGWEVFQENPLGVGTGGFSATWSLRGRFEGTSVFQQPGTSAAHSGWIKILVENGFPGFAVLLMYICSFAYVGWRQRHAGGFTLGVLTTGLFCTTLISYEFEFKAIWLAAAGTTVLLHEPPSVPGRERRPSRRVEPLRP